MNSSLRKFIRPSAGKEMNVNELCERIDTVCEWLGSWGFNISPTRIANYKKYILSCVGEKVSVLEFESVMYDLSELFSIYQNLRSLNDYSLEPLLKELIKGPVRKGIMVGDDRARNFEFELKVIGEYHSLGFALDLTTNADLIVKDKTGAQLLIECKRLTSSKKLAKRIKEAEKQLHKKYKYCQKPNETRGLIFLDVSNLVNTDFKIIRADTLHKAHSFLSVKLESFADDNQELWLGIKDLRTLGVVLYCSVATKINEQLSTVTRIWHGDYLSSNPEDLHFLNEFTKHFAIPNQNLYI